METPTFDEVDVPTISDSMTDKDIASSNFSQVVFPDVPDTFVPKQDIRVSYVISNELVPTSRDWIGLFKVGWTTPREYITFVWSPKPASDNVSAVTFSSYYLPNDESEFYQFCFVTKQGLVKGASTPFQFRERSGHSELVEVEDETGMIVLKTKAAAMQDALDKALKNKESLEHDLKEVKASKDELEVKLKTIEDDVKTTSEALFMEKERSEEAEKRLESLTETHKATEKELIRMKEEIESHEINLSDYQQLEIKLREEIKKLNDNIKEQECCHAADIQALNKQLDEKVQELCNTQVKADILYDNVQELTLHQDELKKSSKDEKERASSYVKKMQIEKDAAIARVLQYKDEKELFQKQFQESEQNRLDLAADVKSITEKIEKKNHELLEAVDKVAAQNEKINILRREIKQQKTHDVKQRKTLEKEMSLVEDRLNASEASKRLIASELSEARESRDQLMSDLNKLKQEKDELLKKLSSVKNEKKICDSVLMELRENAIRDGETIRTMQEESQGNQRKQDKQQTKLKNHVILLQAQLEEADSVVASHHHKLSLQDNEAQTEIVFDDENAVDDESVIDDLKTQIEDLRTRLSMGAAAYTEKYIECHKLEKKLKKIQATTKSPMIREQARAMLESTTTSDSQQDETSLQRTGQKSKSGARKSRRGGASAKKTLPAVGSPEQRSGMLGKLEQLFLAIADPDAEEQEHAQQLQDKLKDLERNVQFQHSKYKKYKLLFQEEKQKNLEEMRDLKIEVERLNVEVVKEQAIARTYQNENKALQEQVSEFVQVSQDENIIKTKPAYEIGLKYGNPYKITSVSSEVVELPKLRHRGIHTASKNIKKSDEDSSSSSDSSLEYFGGPSFLSLCPKNISSDDSDAIEITHPPRESPCASNTVTDQPIRSPPLIEVLEDKEEETPVQKPIKRTTARQRLRKKSRGHKSYA